MPKLLTAPQLKSMLSDGREIALLDVREHGIFGEGHLFFAIPLPYSRFEADLPALVPNPATRIVLCDDGDGTAQQAAARAKVLGYTDIAVLDGGAASWKAAGYTLYQGVNLPSKTFGELVEIERHTPHISAQDLEAMRTSGEDFVIVDGRPLTEYRKMNIPGGICCPNGELPLRISAIAPDPNTKVVVNCAGRTRSIIGAQILIDAGIKNPVVALENGTQGWFLAGLKLENGADRTYPAEIPETAKAERRSSAAAFALKHNATAVQNAQVEAWLREPDRTTFIFDVRTPEEFAANGAPATVHAPGGQLLQATDQWVGVRGARIVVVDDDGIRAPIIAGWLRQQGHETYTLDGGVAAAQSLNVTRPVAAEKLAPLPAISPAQLAAALKAGNVGLIDLRPSMTFRKGHIAGAGWSIRPQITQALGDPEKPVVLVAEDSIVAALAARDLAEAGSTDIRILEGGAAEWQASGLDVEATPDLPEDADCIDYLFFTHERHAGVEAASRQYLEWELGLVDQLDEQERSVYRFQA